MTENEREYHKKAKQGDPEDQYTLGWNYQNGSNGVPKNYKKAVKWYRKAARQGDADAQYNLGWMYENGYGVQKSNVNAYMWYKSAMEQWQERALANYNRIVSNMPSKAIDKAEAKAESKAEGKMAYVKQRIKSFVKFFVVIVFLGAVLVALCAFIIRRWESPVTRDILDVKNYLLDKVDKHRWWSSQEGPPQIQLKEEDFTWLSGPLYGNETDTLSIWIKNYGGYARDMTIELSSNVQGLSFSHSTTVPTIPKNGVETINIPISGDINLLPTIDASLDFQLNEPNHGLKYEKKLFFETRKFRNPQLELSSAAFEETVKEVSNNQINKNDQIKLKFYVQNVGCSEAKEVEIKVANKQRDEDVRFLGIGYEHPNASKEPPKFLTIDAGEYKLITYHYLVTGEFKGSELKFEISATESFNKYGFDKEIVTVALHTELNSLESPTKSPCDEESYKKLRVKNLDKEPRQEPQVIDRENDMQVEELLETTQRFPEFVLDSLRVEPLPELSSLGSKPELVLFDAAISEGWSRSANNNRIDLDEEIELKFYVQNRGCEVAKDVRIEVSNNQKGVDLDSQRLQQFPKIDARKYELVTYRYYISREFINPELRFEISVRATDIWGESSDFYGKPYSIKEIKAWYINTELDPLKTIEELPPCDDMLNQGPPSSILK